MSETKSGHIVELQSLRGIAAMAVMLGHALIYYQTPTWFYTLSWFFNGRAAVVIFFVLSGYVLTRSLRNAQFNHDTVVRFYVQRLFRIYPAIWAASAIGLFYIFAMHWQIPADRPGQLFRSEFRSDRFDTLHIVASLAAMTTFILPPLWSIFVELVASLTIPAIAFITLHRRRWFPVMLGIAIAVSCLIPNTYYHVTMYFMDFIVGAGLAMPGVATRLFAKAPAGPVVLGCLLALALTQYIPVDYYNPAVHLLESGLSATVIGILVGAKRRIPLLQTRSLLFVGDISYSVYLLHYPMLCILGKVLASIPETHALDIVTLSVLLAGMTCATTIPAAWLSFSYVEQPGIQLGKFGLRQTQAMLYAFRR